MRRGPDLDIFQYLSYRQYLDDWFSAQKAADDRFSHRLFARRAGVRSPSLLKEVIGGRRNLTPNTVPGFAKALRLRGESAEFFRALVRLDQADTHAEKNEAWEHVAASRRFRQARPIDGGMMRVLSNWYYLAIRELAQCQDFDPDPVEVAHRLHPRISVAQAREALDTLFELGMLVEEHGHVRAAEVSIATPHEVVGVAAQNYHRGMLQRAAESMESVDRDERHLLGVTVAIPAEMVPTLKAELDAFQERLMHLCDERVADADTVYQINLQLVPLSAGKRSSGGKR